MATNYKINGVAFEDNFVRKDLFSDKGLFLWGQNSQGQVGDNTRTQRSSPVQTVSGSTNWKQISRGRHSAAIKTDGTLWLWGNNNYGQLGINSSSGYMSPSERSSPVQTVAGGTNWKQVSCGDAHTACIKTDGTLWMWGNNYAGKLGDDSRTHRSSPVQTVSGGTNWKQVSCGSYHTAAIKTDGTLWLWGYNGGSVGQLGDNTVTSRSSPVQTVSAGTNWKQVSAGGSHTAAIKTDGTLWTWGFNYKGQLGDNTTTRRSSPVQTVAGGTNWKQVSCADSATEGEHTACIKTDGTLWLWGQASYGRLGTNDTTMRSSPVQTVAGGTNWKQVEVGGPMTYAIKTDGTLWAWGRNNDGQLGDNTLTDRSSPVQTVAGGTNWKQVGGGYDGGIALKNSYT